MVYMLCPSARRDTSKYWTLVVAVEKYTFCLQICSYCRKKKQFYRSIFTNAECTLIEHFIDILYEGIPCPSLFGHDVYSTVLLAF